MGRLAVYSKLGIVISSLLALQMAPQAWILTLLQFFALSLNAVNITMVQVAGVGRHTVSFGDEAPEMLGRWEKVSVVLLVFPEIATAMLISRAGQILYIELLFYSFAIPLPKIVLLLFYIRIFPNPRFKLAVYAVASFVIAWCPAVFFTDMFQCSPVAFAWDKSIHGGTCINVLAFFRYIAVPIVLSDVAVLLLPLPMIWQLHMTSKQKLALSSVFLLGSLGLIASIARRVIFFRSNAFADPTWTAVTLLAWTMVEVEAVLIAACLPPLRPLFISFWQSSSRFASKIHRSGTTHESISSYGGGVQKQGFTRIEDIRRTREVELESVPPPKHDRATAFV